METLMRELKWAAKMALILPVLSFIACTSFNVWGLLWVKGYKEWRESDRASVARYAVLQDRQIRGCK